MRMDALRKAQREKEEETQAAADWEIGSVLLLLILTGAAWWFTKELPKWNAALKVIEYPVYAVGVGLIASGLASVAGIKKQLFFAFRTEFLLKTGVVLLGASINLGEILALGAKGLLQAVILITSVFTFTWLVSSWLQIEMKLRALLASSVAICGVSAAISAAGAVSAKRESLTYVTGLVILFALPLMFLQPILAKWLGVSPDVAGAWIGGNIDTTAAVTGAGVLHSEQALKVASIVKMSQNALIGVVAFLLALYWVAVIEKRAGERPSPWEIWERFPKFVIGFVVSSLITTLGLAHSWFDTARVTEVNDLRTWFFISAFVAIGYSFSFSGIKQAGWKPLLVYTLATLFNTGVALGVAVLLFS